MLPSVVDLGRDPGVQWNPPFGRILRNYEGSCARIWRSCNCVRNAKSISACVHGANYARAHSNSLHKSAS